MHRVTDHVECTAITDKHLDYFTFDAVDWFSKPENFAYREGDNIAFGEYKSPGVYWVHFCFDTARGREAINLTKRMFKRLSRDCPLKIGIGLIGVNNKKAKWLIRQVGFKSLGEIDTANGLCEMFYSHSTKDEE